MMVHPNFKIFLKFVPAMAPAACRLVTKEVPNPKHPVYNTHLQLSKTNLYLGLIYKVGATQDGRDYKECNHY